MRVRTFVSQSARHLDQTLNDFIADKKVIDVRFCTIAAPAADTQIRPETWLAAMVLYEHNGEAQ